jgi:hypothetical protein
MTQPCAIRECDRSPKFFGICSTHWRRVQRGRNVLHEPPSQRERFAKYIDERGKQECWPWQGPMRSDGYGYLYDRRTNRNERAHRVAYELFVGPIPDGLQLDHVCHSLDHSCIGGSQCAHRRCCNPAHLEPVENRENTVRGRAGVVNGGREASKTHCPKGHPYDDENTRLDRNGWRQCRSCERERARGRRTASR